jgi:hypothetical protein
MNIKNHTIILASAIGLLIIGAIVGNILESSGKIEALGPMGITAIKSACFALFCGIGFSLMPILIKFFISAQIKIGNGELFPIKWIQAHEQAVIYGFWILYVIGLCIAVPAAIKDGFFK